MVKMLNIGMDKGTKYNAPQPHERFRHDTPCFNAREKANLQPKHDPDQHQEKNGIPYNAGRIPKMLLIAHV